MVGLRLPSIGDGQRRRRLGRGLGIGHIRAAKRCGGRICPDCRCRPGRSRPRAGRSHSSPDGLAGSGACGPDVLAAAATRLAAASTRFATESDGLGAAAAATGLGAAASVCLGAAAAADGLGAAASICLGAAAAADGLGAASAELDSPGRRLAAELAASIGLVAGWLATGVRALADSAPQHEQDPSRCRDRRRDDRLPRRRSVGTEPPSRQR